MPSDPAAPSKLIWGTRQIVPKARRAEQTKRAIDELEAPAPWKENTTPGNDGKYSGSSGQLI